jgi:predicted nuclease with TOPRIM domain
LEAEAYFPSRLISRLKERNVKIEALSNHIVQEIILAYGTENLIQFKEGSRIYYDDPCDTSDSITTIPTPLTPVEDLPPSKTSVFSYTGRSVQDTSSFCSADRVQDALEEARIARSECDSLRQDVKLLTEERDTLQAKIENMKLYIKHSTTISTVTSFTASRDKLAVEYGKLKERLSNISPDIQQAHARFTSAYNTLSERHRTLTDRYTALNRRFNALSTEHGTLKDRFDSLTTRLDILTTNHNILNLDHDDLVERYDNVTAEYDIYREEAVRQLRKCYDNAIESQQRLVLEVESAKDDTEELNRELEDLYTNHGAPRQENMSWQRAPAPPIIAPLELPSRGGSLTRRVRQNSQLQKRLEAQKQYRQRYVKRQYQEIRTRSVQTSDTSSVQPSDPSSLPSSLTLQDVQLVPGLPKSKVYTLPPSVLRALEECNAPQYVHILAAIGLEHPHVDHWRLIRAARLEEVFGQPLTTTHDIVVALREVLGDTDSHSSDDEPDCEVHVAPSVSNPGTDLNEVMAYD